MTPELSTITFPLLTGIIGAVGCWFAMGAGIDLGRASQGAGNFETADMKQTKRTAQAYAAVAGGFIGAALGIY